jgi:hypothetical protein
MPVLKAPYLNGNKLEGEVPMNATFCLIVEGMAVFQSDVNYSPECDSDARL